jgi:hypothetical protein
MRFKPGQTLGWFRKQYAPSDIHVSQPSQGNDFTLQQVAASDFPSSIRDTIHSIFQLEFTNAQENIRIGRFLKSVKQWVLATPKVVHPTTARSSSPNKIFSMHCITA